MPQKKFMFITGGAVKGYEKLDKVMHNVAGVFSKPFQADTIMKKIREFLSEEELATSKAINK